MPNIISFLRNIVRKKRAEHDLDDEIRFYIETLTEQGTAAGLSEQQARRAARLELGSVDSVKEAVRDVRTGAMTERIWQDLRYAVRALWNKPGFTAAAVLVLALGIGANSAVFSLINAFLLKPLAVHKPERVGRPLQPRYKAPRQLSGVLLSELCRHSRQQPRFLEPAGAQSGHGRCQRGRQYPASLCRHRVRKLLFNAGSPTPDGPAV